MKLADINFLGAAARSTAVARLCPMPEYSVAETLAIARKAALHFQQTRGQSGIQALHNEQATLPLIASARTLFSVGSYLRRLQDGARYGNANELLLSAAVAFAMYGNFPSAHSSIRLVAPEYISGNDDRVVAAALADPRSVSTLLQYPMRPATAQLLLTWERFLRTGDERVAETVKVALEKIMLNSELSEAALLRNARVAMQQAVVLSVARSLRSPEVGLPDAFIEGLLDDNVLTLLPPQHRLLLDAQFASRTENALLNLPTSTGKTLLAECCVAAVLKNGPGLAVIVVPYVALGNQITAALKRHLHKTDIRVTGMFGGFKLDSALQPALRREVLVATPERFDAWLRYNGTDDSLKLVVFDEAHSIANSARGARLEGIITRLRLRQTQRGGFRMIALSAVLADASAFLEFLGVNAANYFVDSWRPTARHLAIWSTTGDLIWVFGNDSLRPSQLAPLSTLGAHMVQWPHSIAAPPTWQKPEAQPKREVTVASQDNVAYLAQYLLRLIGGPILVICMTRESTRLIANAISLRLPDDPTKALSRSRLAEIAATLAPWYPTLPAMILRGVAFHNASVPPELRRQIEEAVGRRELDFVVSTTTLAEGADLPFRVTLVESWIVGFGADARPLDALMFRNIAGRCGRAGMFTEGDTVLYENVLGPAHLTSQQTTRRSVIASMIGSPPALQSALPIDGLKHDHEARYAALSAQVIAAIPENPDDEALAQRLAQFSYARKVLSPQRVDQLFASVVADMLSDSDGEPLAKAASPIRLTDLGAAVNRTGLSTTTARSLRSFLRRETTPRGLYELIVDLILEFAAAPEQTDSYLQKLVGSKKQKGFATVDDLPAITAGWLEQRDAITIFQLMPRYKASKAQEEYKQRQFDKFVQTLDSVYGNFVPWLMRAANQLAPFGAEWSRAVRWMDLAESLEKRVAPDSFEQSEEALDLA